MIRVTGAAPRSANRDAVIRNLAALLERRRRELQLALN